MKVTTLPMSRVIHVRDEEHAMSLLNEARPDLTEAERREEARRLALGYALLVIEEELEPLDPWAPHHDEEIPDDSVPVDPWPEPEVETTLLAYALAARFPVPPSCVLASSTSTVNA